MTTVHTRPESMPADGAFDLIRRQHALIRDLFDEVRTSGGEARRDAFERLVRVLAVHETAEEEVLHPLARARTEGGSALVEARLGEEYEANEVLADLERRGVDDPRFGERLDALRLSVLRHARSEERYELPQLQRTAPGVFDATVPALRAAAAVAPTHPHPGSESATASVLTGPFLAVADRVRDAIRASRRDDGTR